MFGGVLNSLTRKLGQTATKSEVGKLAGLIGGDGAIAKSAPKMTEQVADQIIYHGTPNKFTKFNNDGGSTWFTSNKDKIKDSGLSWNGQGELNIMERKLPSDLKLANRELEDRYTRWELESMGYKGIKYDDIGPDEIYYELFDPNKLPLNEAVPKVMPKRSFKDELEKLRGEVFDANDAGDYMYENPDLESLVSNLGKERGFGLSYDDGWDNYVVGVADRNMPIDVASRNMSDLANEYGFKVTANPDGTYRLYHGTNKKAADSIRKRWL